MLDRDIIFLSNVLANGGAGRVLTLLADELAQRGRRVGVISLNRHPKEYPLGERVARTYLSPAGSRLQKASRLFELRRTLEGNPNAVVIAFEYFVNVQTLIAAWDLPNPVIVSERNDPARVGHRFPMGALRHLLYRYADAVVCQTDEASAYFSDGVRKRVILNPLNPNLPSAFQGARRKTVVTFGRLESQKNLDLLIAAFAEFRSQHSEYSLEVYGDGSERERLTQVIEDFELSGAAKILEGRADVLDCVRDCAMFVISSDYEGLSNSMLEALALGVPTISTDSPCGGARMVIQDGRNGLLVPVGDVNALSGAMSRIAEDPALAAELTWHGSQLRDRLSVAVIADEWEQLIAGVSG